MQLLNYCHDVYFDVSSKASRYLYKLLLSTLWNIRVGHATNKPKSILDITSPNPCVSKEPHPIVESRLFPKNWPFFGIFGPKGLCHWFETLSDMCFGESLYPKYCSQKSKAHNSDGYKPVSTEHYMV